MQRNKLKTKKQAYGCNITKVQLQRLITVACIYYSLVYHLVKLKKKKQYGLSHPVFSVSSVCCSSLAFSLTSDPSFCSFSTSCCTWSRVACNSPTCDSNFFQSKLKHQINLYKNNQDKYILKKLSPVSGNQH